MKGKKMKTETPNQVSQTTSDAIWTAIKDLPIEVYSLPAQRVEQHTQRFLGSPDAVFLKLTSSAILPALEAAVGKKYDIELTEAGYILVKAAQEKITPPALKPASKPKTVKNRK